MPIDTVQQLLHLRTKKNKAVLNSIERLWALGSNAKTADDILNGLHPWGKETRLKFYNVLPKLFILCAILSLALAFVPFFYTQLWLVLLSVATCLFFAFLFYESNRPIYEVIEFLEQRMNHFRYCLVENHLPNHLGMTTDSNRVIGHLRNKFPLFRLGNVDNVILKFASTEWQSESGKVRPAILYHYRYTTETIPKLANIDQQNSIEVEKHRWGVFIFNVPNYGLAASKKYDKFPYPYTVEWKASDLISRNHFKIFGTNNIDLAKNLSPKLLLKFSDFYQKHSGDIMFHPDDQILCFMGRDNIFEVQHRQSIRDIQNISELRGYLRTQTMPKYLHLKQSMLDLLA